MKSCVVNCDSWLVWWAFYGCDAGRAVRFTCLVCMIVGT